MERRAYLNILYDYYQSLLTEKERTCFLDYYESDYSLAEIAENNNVSRSAIHKTLKIVIEKLENYETELKMFQKREAIIESLIGKIDQDSLEKIKNILS